MIAAILRFSLVQRMMIVLLLCSVTAPALCASPPVAESDRYWERFPKPPGRAEHLQWMGLDRYEQLWVMWGQGTYTWDRARKQWTEPVLRAGVYLTRLYKGPENRLYATQPAQEDHWGKVYHLPRNRKY